MIESMLAMSVIFLCFFVLILAMSPAIIIFVLIKIVKKSIAIDREAEIKRKEEKEQRLKEEEKIKRELSKFFEIILINVEKDPQDEVFHLYHKECYGGKIKRTRKEFRCQRCEKEFNTTREDYKKISSAIAKTAIDGKQREIDVYDWHGGIGQNLLFRVVLNKKAP